MNFLHKLERQWLKCRNVSQLQFSNLDPFIAACFFFICDWVFLLVQAVLGMQHLRLIQSLKLLIHQREKD